MPLEEVQANFARYGLLDERVRFLVGWFADTLPAAPIERLAVLRLDGDMYGSTMEALEALYPKLSVGGYVIIDDYGAIPRCKEAVTTCAPPTASSTRWSRSTGPVSTGSAPEAPVAPRRAGGP